jgi:hypothetical protein
MMHEQWATQLLSFPDVSLFFLPLQILDILHIVTNWLDSIKASDERERKHHVEVQRTSFQDVPPLRY